MEQIPEWKRITKNISYITPTNEPLSANVSVVEGEKYIWVYDVGSHKDISNMLLELSQEKNKGIRVILSHFHPDHIANLQNIEWTSLYQGKNTYKYTHIGEIVENEIQISDGDININIFPISSSHAKGSLAIMVDETHCLLGDALYPAQKGDRTVFNVGILKQQINTLKMLEAQYVLISHREPFVQKKQVVVSWLENMYSMREKNEPWLEIDRKYNLENFGCIADPENCKKLCHY